MNLLQASPLLRRHPLLEGKRTLLIGVSTITRDETAYVFEIGKPRTWKTRQDGATSIGIGGIGGAIEKDEAILDCLRREVKEELGARVRLELHSQTYLIQDWRVCDALRLTPSKKHPTPLMVILTPPRLGGPDTPDHLAILAFLTRLQDPPAPRDLFGLLRVERRALPHFFARDEWPLAELQAHPGLEIILNDQPPAHAALHFTLTARAFQLLVRGGHTWDADPSAQFPAS